MSIEGGNSLGEHLSPERRRRAEQDMSESPRISQDYTNAWTHLPYLVYQRAINRLEPIRHYEEYFRNKPREPQEVVDYIMNMSNQEAVAALDRAVMEFNSDLERIKQEEDWEAINRFIAKMKQLMGRE